MPRSAERTNCRSEHQRGFTLLEMVVVIILVILLFLVAYDRLMPLRGQAEAAHVATTIGTLRSALGMTTASRIISDGPRDIAALDGHNPLELLQQPPDRYAGEITSTDAAEVTPGQWFFETDTGRLGYRIRFPQYLENAPQGPIDLYWRVVVDYDDRDENGRFDPETDRIRSVTLQPLHQRHWQSLNVSESVASE